MVGRTDTEPGHFRRRWLEKSQEGRELKCPLNGPVMGALKLNRGDAKSDKVVGARKARPGWCTWGSL